MAQVPFFTDESAQISQSMAIIQYIDQVYPDPALFPKDAIEKAKVIELCEVINSGIQPLQNLSFMNALKNQFNADDAAIKTWCQQVIQKGLEAYQALCTSSWDVFSVGSTPTAAEAFLIPQLYNARRFDVDLSRLETLLKIEEECNKLMAFDLSHPNAQPDTPEEGTF